MAVRNADGGFFLCQAMNNVYKSSPKIRIRWLSEDAANKHLYSLDFYDTTDIECVLTSVTLNKMAKGKLELTKAECDRIENILKKALDVEKGIVERPDVTEENPDGCESIRALFLYSFEYFNGFSFHYFQWIFLCTKTNLRLRRKLLLNAKHLISQTVQRNQRRTQRNEKLTLRVRLIRQINHRQKSTNPQRYCIFNGCVVGKVKSINFMQSIFLVVTENTSEKHSSSN